MVASPHCGAGSLSDDLSSDEIPATGGHQSFVPAGKTLSLRRNGPPGRVKKQGVGPTTCIRPAAGLRPHRRQPMRTQARCCARHGPDGGPKGARTGARSLGKGTRDPFGRDGGTGTCAFGAGQSSCWGGHQFGAKRLTAAGRTRWFPAGEKRSGNGGRRTARTFWRGGPATSCTFGEGGRRPGRTSSAGSCIRHWCGPGSRPTGLARVGANSARSAIPAAIPDTLLSGRREGAAGSGGRRTVPVVCSC